MKRILSFLLVISFIFMLGVNTSAENILEYFNSISSVRYIGDVDGDGKVNSFDALQILRYSVGSLGIIDKKVADLNSDGKINSADALLVLKIAVLGLEGDYWQDDTEEDESKAPSSKADIVAYYNNAINKVIEEKAGFKKSRETVMHTLDGGALFKIQLVVDMVNDFLGVGITQWDNRWGEQTNISKAALTEADLTGATCTDNNGIYTITLALKDGSSSADGSGNVDTSPLQRAGVFAGKGDKKAYDYKNSENIHTAINGVDNCTAESAIEKVTNTKIVAVVDSKTGNLQSLTALWDWHVELTKVKYTFVSINSAKGNATTIVKFTDFNFEGPIAPKTKADLIKFINEETAKAAKGNYKITRSGKFIKNINVGSATNALNSIIKGVDENASLDSVVGGFLGIKAQPITGTVTNGQGEGFDAKYMLKGMNLTEADVTSYSVNGNKYTFVVKDCRNPNASSAMAHATNDYITYAEVNQSIANEIGNAVKVVENESVANYKNIKFIVTVDNGKITAMEYSYSLDATLKLKLAIINATGTGEAAITGKYTDIEY